METPRLLAAPAGSGDLGALQAVLEAAPSYHRLADGTPARPGAAADLLADAEADADRRLWLLWLRPGRLAAGVLDLQLHWPDPDDAHVRLLLLREALHGRGLGREATEGLEAVLRAEGFRALRLSVADENDGARAFWERLGFGTAARLADAVTVYEKLL